MLRLLILICMFAAWPGVNPAHADDRGSHFVAVALHDVVDTRRELGDDAMTTGSLIEFFEWLRGNGWTAISVDDIARAARGERPLPPRAILITFDDGYRSLYTRVFPLLLAYRIPVVSALVGTWMDAPMDAQVQYDQKIVPRRNFISWAEAREMQASGLVEFGAHSYNLHQGVTGNPQGNVMPSAVTLRYQTGTGYEDADAQRRRIEADARRMHSLLNRELGRAPRVWVWPYGRYSQIGIEAVAAAGFGFALTLDAGPGDARTPMSIARQYPGADASLAAIASMVRLQRNLPAAQRLVCLDPGELWTGDAASTDERLGQAIERMRKLGATAVVVDAVTREADGRPGQAWFATGALPVMTDLLSRIVWQLQTRAGVEVHVRLSSRLAQQRLGDPARTLELFRDLGASVPLSGLLIDDLPALARLAPAADAYSGQPWETRSARNRLEAGGLQPSEKLAMDSFREIQRMRPWASLTVVTDEPAAPGTLADLTLLRLNASGDPATLAAGSDTLFKSMANRRSGIWLSGSTPPSSSVLRATTRRFQQLGGTAVGWCPDSPVANLPVAGEVAPDVSASTFPVRF